MQVAQKAALNKYDAAVMDGTIVGIIDKISEFDRTCIEFSTSRSRDEKL